MALKIKYEVKETEEGKKVYFPEYSSDSGWCVNKDKDGYEYVHIPNVYFKDEDIFYRMNGHAIKAVFDGYAHGVQGSNGIFGNNPLNLSPIIFLGEEYGEQVRKKTMDGFKTVTWKYGVMFGNKNSFSSGYLINDTMDNDLSLDFDKKMKPLLFLTREEAKEAIEKLKWEAESFIQNRMILNNEDKDQFYKKLVDDVLGSTNKIIERVMMWTEVKDNKIERNYHFSIVEVIDQKGDE